LQHRLDGLHQAFNATRKLPISSTQSMALPVSGEPSHIECDTTPVTAYGRASTVSTVLCRHLPSNAFALTGLKARKTLQRSRDIALF
jgi:hypothetical protein